jgi:hypothetical protein
MSGGYATAEFATAMSGGSSSGSYSTAIGPYTTATDYAQVVVGQNNMPNGTDELFVVGNGEVDTSSGMPGTPSNAFVVKRNGDVTVSNTLTAQAIVVKTVLRLPPSGDLSMGGFTAGSNPAN